MNTGRNLHQPLGRRAHITQLNAAGRHVCGAHRVGCTPGSRAAGVCDVCLALHRQDGGVTAAWPSRTLTCQTQLCKRSNRRSAQCILRPSRRRLAAICPAGMPRRGCGAHGSSVGQPHCIPQDRGPSAPGVAALSPLRSLDAAVHVWFPIRCISCASAPQVDIRPSC